MGRASRVKRRKAAQGKHAQSFSHMKTHVTQQGESTPYVSNIDITTHPSIISLLLDKKGGLEIPDWKSNVKKIKPITFPGVEPRYQLELREGGPIFEAIKRHLEQEKGESLFLPSEIYAIKLLIGGGARQKFHQDITPKDGISEEMIAQIRKECNSVLMSCDLAHPRKLSADPKAGATLGSWEEDTVESFKSCKTNPKPRLVVDPHDQSRAIFSGYCLVLDGGVSHAGVPCLGSTEPSRALFGKPLEQLARVACAPSKKGPMKLKSSLTKPELESIPRLASMCRLLTSTWPKRLEGRRSEFAREDHACA